MNLDKKHQIRLGLLFILGVLILFAMTNSSDFLVIPVDMPVEFDLPMDNFVLFALLTNIFYEMIPSVAKQFYSTGAIGVKLLVQGFSPILFGILLAVGQLIGQMILYGIGMIIKHVKKGSIGNLAGKSHFLHQHHFLVYLIVPFAGVLGDAAMIYSGHERINPLKIIPFLFVSNLASNYHWIYTQIINIELSNSFGANN